jgi:hypothetical protein
MFPDESMRRKSKGVHDVSSGVDVRCATEYIVGER